MGKRFFLTALLLFILFIPFQSVFGEDFQLDVKAAILIDAETGQILYQKNIDEKLPPASITKIMTLLIAMEQVEEGVISLEDEVTISRLAESMGGSQIYLAAGSRVKIKDLLKAVTIASANDASVALAEALAGTYDNFVAWMNRRAEELGMLNTHFENSTGLPTNGEHYSTARDIAIMARELVKYPQVLEWSSIWVDYLQLPEREAMLVNTNKLINKYPGMDGLKTGHTDAAGFCLTATAQRDGLRLISVVLNAATEAGREEATTRLLDYGFNTFKRKLVVQKGEQVQNIEVPAAKKTTTTAEAAKDLYVLVKRGQENTLSKEIVIKENLQAPIKKGEPIGSQRIIQEGQVLGEVELIASEDIEKAGFFTRLWRAFINWIGGILDRFLKN